jgi:hypothetical protein
VCVYDFALGVPDLIVPCVSAYARPELVKSWKKPLSSDAFSNFGVDNHEEHEAEVHALSLGSQSSARPFWRCCAIADNARHYPDPIV